MRQWPLAGLFQAPPDSAVYRFRPRSPLDLITQAWFVIGGVVVFMQAAHLDWPVQWPFVVLTATWPALRIVHDFQEWAHQPKSGPVRYL